MFLPDAHFYPNFNFWKLKELVSNPEKETGNLYSKAK